MYVIYGRPKVGKTTFALSEANMKETAIINADDGLVGIDTTGATIINDMSSASLNKDVLSPAFLKKHKRIVLDTATSLYDLMLSEANGGKSPTLQSRGVVNNAFTTLVRTLKSPDREVIVLAQERLVAPTEDWYSEDDEEEQVASVSVDLPKGAASSLVTLSDVIGRLYIARKEDRTVRRLWLTPTPGIVAGARTSKYKGKPPYLANPSVSRLNQLLGW